MIDTRVRGVSRKVLKSATGTGTDIVDKLNEDINYILEFIGQFIKVADGVSEEQLQMIYYVRFKISKGLRKLKSVSGNASELFLAEAANNIVNEELNKLPMIEAYFLSQSYKQRCKWYNK